MDLRVELAEVHPWVEKPEESARLLIADAPEVSQDCAAKLARAGHRAETAATAAEALEKALAADFDLMLADIDLRFDDGPSLLDRVKRVQPSLPVVVSSRRPTVERVVSTEEQRERQSIETQRDFAHRFCRDNAIQIIAEHPDDGVSGTIPLEQRPEGTRLLRDAEAKTFDTLLVYKAVSTARHMDAEGGTGYGYLWKSIPVGDLNIVFASGTGGQFVAPIPSLDAVIVTTAKFSTDKGDVVTGLLLQYVVPALAGGS